VFLATDLSVLALQFDVPALDYSSVVVALVVVWRHRVLMLRQTLWRHRT
jgi:hypothetical protein